MVGTCWVPGVVMEKIRMLPCSIMDWLLNLQEKLNCVMQQAVLRKEITKKDLQKHWKLHAGLM